MAGRFRSNSFTFYLRFLNYPQDALCGSLDSGTAYFGKIMKQLFRVTLIKVAKYDFNDLVIHAIRAIRWFFHERSIGHITAVFDTEKTN
jgi:hypothetical protein